MLNSLSFSALAVGISIGDISLFFEGWIYSDQLLFAGDLGRTCWSLGLNGSHLKTVGQFTCFYFPNAMLADYNQWMFINKDTMEENLFKIIQFVFS